MNVTLMASRYSLKTRKKFEYNQKFCAIQKTFVGIKPDAFRKGLADTLEIRLLDETGLKECKKWVGAPDKRIMEVHYEEHKNKPFFDSWIESLAKGPFEGIILEGDDAVNKARVFVEEIRKSFGVDERENLMHAARTEEEATKEINNFFQKKLSIL